MTNDLGMSVNCPNQPIEMERNHGQVLSIGVFTAYFSVFVFDFRCNEGQYA